MDLRVSLIPFVRNAIKDQSEIPFIARLQRIGTNRLRINIGLTHADQIERQSLSLGKLSGKAPESYLNHNSIHSLSPTIGYMAIDIGHFAAS